MANKFLSREEYLNQKRQAIIEQSLENSRNRILPTVPLILRESEKEWKENINNLIEVTKNKLNRAIQYNHGKDKVDGWQNQLNRLNDELNKGYVEELCAGDSCIYTATDNYGKKYRISGNKSFRANPSKYGFKEINLNDIKPGDIIQDFSLRDNAPHHAITFIGYDDNNKALFNYSKGGGTKEDIVKNGHYSFIYDDDNNKVHLDGVNNNKLQHRAAAYRFIGTEDDNKEWEKQYYIDRSNFHKQIAEELKQVPTLTLPNRVISIKRLGGEHNNKNILNIIERYIKTKAMAIAQGLQYNNFRLDTTGSDIVNNKHDRVGEASYLYNKKDFENAYLNSGYIKGKEGDYGLVQKAVGNRNLPIFQKNIDDATRDNLIILGNPKEDYIAPNKRLYDAGEYPTAMYIDKNGNVYQKAWDLNDYGKDAKGYSGDRGYSNIKQKAANFLDRIGNPHVVTTGFVKLDDAGLKHFLNNEKEDINIQRKILQYENNKNIALEYLNHLDTLYQNGSEYINKRLYELLNDKIDKKGMGGMKQDKVFKLKGGMAVPLDNKKKLFYLSGAKHEQGGIDVTPELEAEGGEVIKVNPKSIKVITAQKIMGGKSPAELVVNASSTGEQDKVFNKVFKYQEDFKDRNNLNDDGTSKAKFGILKKFKNWLFNIPSGFERVKENDSPTKEASEFIENDIAKRQESFYKIAKEKGHDSEPYFIPYIDNKEIIINGAGRASSNMLDSLVVNSKKAKVPFTEALGLAVEESKVGAIPNVSTKAWEDSFMKTNGRKPNNDEIKEFENKILNSSFARNFGGIHPQFLINNHEWFKRGWEDSNKYKNILKDIKSPLQHGLTLYKLGLYNTGDKYHKTKVQSAGNKAIKSKDVQNWLKTSEYAKQIEKYRLGGQMKNKKKANLGIFNPNAYLWQPEIEPAKVTAQKLTNDKLVKTLNEFGEHYLYKPESKTNSSVVVVDKPKKSFGEQIHPKTQMYQPHGYLTTPKTLAYINPFWNYNVRESINLNRGDVPIPYKLEEEIVTPVEQSIETKVQTPIQTSYKTTTNTTTKAPVVQRTAPTTTTTTTTNKTASTPVVENTTKSNTNYKPRLDTEFLNEVVNPDGSITNFRTGQTYFKDLNKIRRSPYSQLNLKTGQMEYAGYINPYGAEIQPAVYNNGPKGRQEREAKERLLNTGDWINIGTNAVGALTNLITGLATPNIRYARMKDATPVIAPKINANVNTTAEESAIDQQYYDELNAIDENTANSQTALNRKRNAAARRAAAKVKVRSAAENTRRGLINESNKLAAEYQKYNIARQENIDTYNRQAEAAEFNANRTKVGDAITGFVSDLGLGASTITNAIEKREADRINTVLSYMGNPEVNPSEFGKGFNDIYEKLYGKKPSNYLRKKYSKR